MIDSLMVTHQSATMMMRLYQIILLLAQPLVRLRLRRRARREPAYGERQAERFGQVPESIRSHTVWFHTVSAGETIAAAPLIRQLAAEYSDTPFLVTTMTPTGSQQVVERLGDCVDHCYAPYDFKSGVQRFFSRVQPKILILMETELWPNLIGTASAAGIPVLLVNARLSEHSARGYQRISGLSRPMLRQLSDIACQSQDHVDRFVSLGADPATTRALGSVKYDVSLPADFEQQVAAWRACFALQRQPVWIAASTHPGEDALVIAAFQTARQTLPNLVLVLVPRHPVRTDEVVGLAQKAGFTVARQSVSAANPQLEAADIIVGDVMGTLLELYGLAQVAFVGGSLVDVGGHNPLEPAVCGLPVLSGPHQFNFTDVMAALERNGALQTVSSEQELAQGVIAVLTDPERAQRCGAAAIATVAENRGATERLMQLLRLRINSALAQ
jgi:3-deoxy-D-manno-octulosonic-acid transferase